MFGKEKMKGEREKDNFSGEKTYLTSKNQHHYNQQVEKQQKKLEGVSSSSSYTNGFCYSEVGSSSLTPFDHSHNSTPKSHIVDQLHTGACNFPESYYRRANNGVVMDGLAREFQRVNIGNVSSDVGQFHKESDFLNNVAEFRPSTGENFGVLGGFHDNAFSGNGGFQSSVYRDGKSVKDEINLRLGQRIGNFGDSLGLNSAYAVHGHQNCLINFPLDGTVHQGDEFYENGAPPIRGNRYYDRMPGYGPYEFLGNGSVSRGNEFLSNGGVVPRGDVGYGSEIPFQVESGYGPPIVGDPLQQYVMDGRREMLSMYNKGFSNEGFVEQYGRQFPVNLGGLNSLDVSQLMYAKQALGRGDVLFHSMREKLRAVEQREDIPPIAQMKRAGRHHEPYGFESRFTPEKGSNGLMGKNYQLSGRARKFLGGNTLQNFGDSNFGHNVPLQTDRAFGNGSSMLTPDPLHMQPLLNRPLAEVRNSIYFMAKDQNGCRFLQKKFEEGPFEDVQIIFAEIHNHVVELMMNPFGNYLIQKLLDVCNDDQKMKIVQVVTRNRWELVRISLNAHGTRVVQKLIRSLKTKRQISLVLRALEPGLLELSRDLNGNHVVQTCLEFLSRDENKSIFDAAARHVVEMATHRHGCCVLQRCIASSEGKQQKNMIDQIVCNGFPLAQDPFGNYVVQYVIEQSVATVKAALVGQFEGHIVQLSTQKFGSHVVEKCLKWCEQSRGNIVYELISFPRFEELVQDPYANYVLQSALENTKQGPIYESLVSAIRPHSTLRTSPFCKKIFTRALLKK